MKSIWNLFVALPPELFNCIFSFSRFIHSFVLSFTSSSCKEAFVLGNNRCASVRSWIAFVHWLTIDLRFRLLTFCLSTSVRLYKSTGLSESFGRARQRSEWTTAQFKRNRSKSFYLIVRALFAPTFFTNSLFAPVELWFGWRLFLSALSSYDRSPRSFSILALLHFQLPLKFMFLFI